MHFFIEKFKISNFLSFFGMYEINLKPFSGIMCNFEEGKNDLIRAFEFVFGAELSELNVENPRDLVHKVLREEFVINNNVQSFVEITINFVQESKKIKFWRGLKNGANSLRIEHKISDVITPKTAYDENLNLLNLSIKHKNLIFLEKFFTNAIWGSPDDFELILDTCLRETYVLEQWKKARKEVEFLTNLIKRTRKKKYNSMKNSHNAIVKYTSQYNYLCSNYEYVRNQIFNEVVETSSQEDFSTNSDEKLNDSEVQSNEKINQINTLDTKMNFLKERLHELKMKEAVLQSHLYHKEIKLASNFENHGYLKNRINEIEGEIKRKDKQLFIISKKLVEAHFELQDLSHKISNSLISLNEFKTFYYLRNRLTEYGRFSDYMQPSRYLQLLKQILGTDIFYANLCDSSKSALDMIHVIRDLEYEHREVFVIFENYSHKLKDTIIASGEKGVEINTLEQLLIFLCKLKHYNLIDEVPIIIQKEFNYEDEMPGTENFVIYMQNGLFFTRGGLISYKPSDDTSVIVTENEIKKEVIKLETEQAIKFQELNDLIFSKWETLFLMNSLEKDVFFFLHNWKENPRKIQNKSETLSISEIYSDYIDFFFEFNEEWHESGRDLDQEEISFSSIPMEQNLQNSVNLDDEICKILKELNEVLSEEDEIQKLIIPLTQELRSHFIYPSHNLWFQKHCLQFESSLEKSKIFFEIECKKLKKLMVQDDLENFLGSKEWREKFILSLIRDMSNMKHKLKLSNDALRSFATERKRKLYPFLEHCSHHLSLTFSHLIDGALPFIDLNLSSGEESLQLTTGLGEDRVNIVNIKHFNTFLKFISVLSLFLQVALFDNIPLLIFDNIEEYFPLAKHDTDIEELLDPKILEKIIPENKNASFHLQMRIGQFLAYYVKKNTPGNHVRNNGSDKDLKTGPMQILYFAKKDFIQASEHYVWIRNQILPDEYIMEDCNCYSEIHEIKF